VIKAYLSYRRVEGELSPLAESLLDWTPHEIQLKADCRDAALSRPIDEFLDELKTSSSVVFLLNDAYFKSPWCLGELHAFLERRNASYHGFFIACEGWMPKRDSGDFFTKLKESLLDHWQRIESEAPTDAFKEEAGIFIQDLPEMLGILQRLNLPQETEIAEQQGAQVWERLKAQRKRAESDYLPCDADTLSDECLQEMANRLARSSQLRRALALKCNLEPEADHHKLASSFWNIGMDLSDSLSLLHMAAAQALGDAEAERREELIQDIRDTLGLFLLRTLDGKVRDQVLRPDHGFLDADYLELAESQPEIVELCFSSSEPEAKPRLEFDRKSGKLVVPKDRYYERNKVEIGPRFSADSALDAQLCVIWNMHFPDEPKKPGDYLIEPEEYDRLHKSLKRNFKRGDARYFLVPLKDGSHPLNKQGVISKLKYHFPYLFIFRTGVLDRPSLISADYMDFEIKDELASFAKLFARHMR
jgi:hypothetical protein